MTSRKKRRRRGRPRTAPPAAPTPATPGDVEAPAERFDPQASWPTFTCPHCFRRLDRRDLVPWYELLRCEWSGRSYLKIHDMKWDYELARLTPAAARALVQADEAERSAALAVVRTIGERRVDAGAIDGHLRARIAAGAIEPVEAVEFAYLRHPRAVAWLAVPALAAALVAAAVAIIPLLSPVLAIPAVLAAATLALGLPLGRLLRRPFRLTLAGPALELARAGKIESWPLAGITCRLATPRRVAGLYVRANPAVLRHETAEVTVHPDLPRFDELVRRLRAGGANVQGA